MPIFLSLLGLPMCFPVFGKNPATKRNRGTYLVGWLIVAGLAVLWNINPEVWHHVFGPLYRFIGLFSSLAARLLARNSRI